MTEPQVWLNITDAAKEAGISRRTLERWISQGKVSPVIDPRNRRLKLVRLPDVRKLADESKSRQKSTAANRISATFDIEQFQDVIDATLRIVEERSQYLIDRLFPEPSNSAPIEALRLAPLGRDLQRLALVALGKEKRSQRQVLEAIESVVQLLFWPPMTYDYSVPRSFWATPLGQMLSTAKFQSYDESELVSVREAAEMLDVAYTTLFRWIEVGRVSHVRDKEVGRIYLLRREIEELVEEFEDHQQHLVAANGLSRN